MKEKTLLLHLAVPKTATTAVQKLVFKPVARSHQYAFNPQPMIDIFHAHLHRPNLSEHGRILRTLLQRREESIVWISDETLLSYNSSLWINTLVSIHELLCEIQTDPDLRTRLLVVTREAESWYQSSLIQLKLNGLRSQSSTRSETKSLTSFHSLDSTGCKLFCEAAVDFADYFVERSDQLVPVLKGIQNDGYIPQDFDIEVAMMRKVRQTPSLRSATLVTRLIDPLFPPSVSDYSFFYSRLAATEYPHLSSNFGLKQYLANRGFFPNRLSQARAFVRHLVFNFRIHLVTLLARILTALGL